MSKTIPLPWAEAGVAPGARISGYRLEEQLGRGGMAVVFRAHDERLDRQVALKILAPSLAQDEAFRQRFIHESRAAAAVDDPYIIPVYEAGEADGVLFIAMRLVRGGDLRTLVAENGPLEPDRAEWILSAVASALDSAHARGLVHRDVKPANMLLDARTGRPDHVYLSDFGVSKAALSAGALTSTGQFIGTADYAAPEQIRGRQVDGQTDQYALGCSAFELLSGQPPFAGKEWLAAMYAHLSDEPPSLAQARPGLPSAVDEVMARVLAKAPGARYPSCQDFTRALRSALGLPGYGRGSAERPSMGADRDATVDPAAVRAAASRRDGSAALPEPRNEAVGAALVQPGSETVAAPATNGATQSSVTTARTIGGQALAETTESSGGPGRVARMRRLVAVASAVVVVVAGTAVAFALTRSPAPAAVPYLMRKQSFGNGLAVSQRWTLGGSNGNRLSVTIQASNSTPNSVEAQLAEPIPQPVAPRLSTVKFTPTAAIEPVIRAVLWELRLPPRGSRTVSYQVPEASAGATEARLLAWVQDFRDVESLEYLTPVVRDTLVSLTIRPAVLRLSASQGGRLLLRGTLHDGRPEPTSALARAQWMTGDAAVATVNTHGYVIGQSPGETEVVARIGDISAAATVIVLGAGGSGPGPGPTQPPYSPSPSASLSVSPSNSVSVSNSVSTSVSVSVSVSVSASTSTSSTVGISPSAAVSGAALLDASAHPAASRQGIVSASSLNGLVRAVIGARRIAAALVAELWGIYNSARA